MSWRVYIAIMGVLGICVIIVMSAVFLSTDNPTLPVKLSCEAAIGEAYDSHNLSEEGTIAECEAEVRRLLEQLDDCYGGPNYICCEAAPLKD